MIHALILADNTYSSIHIGVNRAPGAHRIATHLRQNGYHVEVIDYCLRWTLDEFQTICHKLVTEKMLFLGIGASLFFDKPILNELLVWFKQKYPHIPIVLGGSNVIYRDIEPVDYLLDGYAENAVLDLMQTLQGKKSHNDLLFSSKGDVKFIDCNKQYSKIDITNLSIDYLQTDFIHPNQTLGIETARGCIFKCEFCTYPLIGKKKIDYLRDPLSLKEELLRNHDLWGVTRYIINEDTLNDSIEKLRSLEKIITSLPFKIEFVAYNRLDLLLAHPESVEILDTIGLRAVHFGVETFNSRAAKIIGKNPDINRMKEGLLWLKQRLPHVAIQCGMILGLPEDDNDPWEDVDWYRKSEIDFYNFNPLYLTDVNRVVNTSGFSRNYKSYGFELMSASEIEREIEQGFGDPKEFMHNRNGIWVLHKNKAHLEKILYWKNVKTGDNYFKSSRLSLEIAAKAKERRTMSWTLFEYTSLGYTIDECRNWNSHRLGVNPFPEQELTNRAEQLIHNYKTSKINFDYSSFYNKK